jgi:hypothetical protein
MRSISMQHTQASTLLEIIIHDNGKGTCLLTDTAISKIEMR